MYADKYIMKTGDVLEYTSSETLLPDGPSEAMGYEAGQVVDCVNFLNPNFDRPVRVLEAGVGGGICLAATAAGSRYATAIDLHGFDINPVAVSTTEHNLASISSIGSAVIARSIYVADWHNEDDKNRIAQDGPYDVILCNPPYLPMDTPLFEGYENTPPEAVYSDSEDGLEQYRQVLPWLGSLLSESVGASLLFRRPFSSFSNSQELIDKAMEMNVAATSRMVASLGPVVISTRLFSLLRSGSASPVRQMATTTISRPVSGSSVAPHFDPQMLL